MTDWTAKLKEWEAACDKATPGPWWLSENDGAIRSDAGHVSDNDLSSGDETFVIIARTALPEAVVMLKLAHGLASHLNDLVFCPSCDTDTCNGAAHDEACPLGQLLDLFGIPVSK